MSKSKKPATSKTVAKKPAQTKTAAKKTEETEKVEKIDVPETVEKVNVTKAVEEVEVPKAVKEVDAPKTVEEVEVPETVKKADATSETVKKPDVTASEVENNEETGTKVASDKPIVLLIVSDKRLTEMASKSFMENFVGEIEALVVRYPKEGESIAETLQEFAMDYENEKIILLDNIISVSPFTLSDIEVIKAQRSSAHMKNPTKRMLQSKKLPVTDYATKTPVLLERSKIIELLEENNDVDFKELDFVSVYFNRFFSHFRPILTDWEKDSFTLPIVSKSPKQDVLKNHLQLKKWFAVSANSVDAVLDFFSEAE